MYMNYGTLLRLLGIAAVAVIMGLLLFIAILLSSPRDGGDDPF